MIVLEAYDRVGPQVGDVALIYTFLALRVGVSHKPSDVSEKEAPINVRAVGISSGVLVVSPVLFGPHYDTFLAGQRLQDHQNYPELPFGFEASM